MALGNWIDEILKNPKWAEKILGSAVGRPIDAAATEMVQHQLTPALAAAAGSWFTALLSGSSAPKAFERTFKEKMGTIKFDLDTLLSKLKEFLANPRLGVAFTSGKLGELADMTATKRRETIYKLLANDFGAYISGDKTIGEATSYAVDLVLNGTNPGEAAIQAINLVNATSEFVPIKFEPPKFKDLCHDIEEFLSDPQMGRKLLTSPEYVGLGKAIDAEVTESRTAIFKSVAQTIAITLTGNKALAEAVKESVAEITRCPGFGK